MTMFVASLFISVLLMPPIAEATILSPSGISMLPFTIPAVTPLLLSPASVPMICAITVILTHQPKDTVTIQAASHGPLTLGPAVAGGFAAASIDIGVSANPWSPESCGLKENGEVNLGVLTNFASRSVREMTVIGKAVTESFYGKRSQYQELLDGILAGAPWIYWPTYVIAELWSQVVMKEVGVYPSPDELNAVVAAAILVCGEIDEVKDGVINEPEKKIYTRPETGGRQLWYGIPIGAPLDSLANTTAVNGTRIGFTSFVPDTWTRYFVKWDPGYRTTSIELCTTTCLTMRILIYHGFNTPGGNFLVWHGGAYQPIFPQGGTLYVQRVGAVMNHYGFGTTPGARTSNAFEMLIAWAEYGITLEFLKGQTLPLASVQLRRKICRYPLVSRYRGFGNMNELKSFECV
ncbi:uncharacterized protein BDR25DRAFT_321905 [Lindgomyces ingoldianus]|uniref:Uncharacterized protein n=1 Tax=Lindgomyces ingoldianus TaxID=673940 RepID=A0ACB6RDP5_9PLEO|nr:uncharacterized protein BDR25DRAFT_321905 [Lindgomyces ingoldianus]KAF2476452.1 hypothetical protein BDR25DRAFT_321905 [Lindgomyces ingoldianus]